MEFSFLSIAQFPILETQHIKIHFCQPVGGKPVVLVSQGCCNRIPQTGWQQNRNWVSDSSGTGCPKSLYGRVGPYWGSEEEFVLCFSPSFWWLLAILGLPWLIKSIIIQSLPLSPHGILLCISVFKFPSSNNTRLDTLIQYDLLSRLITWLHLQKPISKDSQVHRFWMDTNFGGTHSTQYVNQPSNFHSASLVESWGKGKEDFISLSF